MRFFWVIILFGSQLLSAASVAVITEDNASLSTTCSAGTINLTPCPPGIPGATGGISGPNYQVNADAGLSPTDPPTVIPGSRMVSVYADAGVLYTCSELAPCPPYVPLSANAESSQTISGYTEGASRLGSIQLSVTVGSENAYPPAVLITDGTNVYGIGDGAPPGSLNPCCGGSYDATLPFRLGGTFEVSASATYGLSMSSCPEGNPSFCGEGGSENAAISFVFLEPDGSPIPFGTQVTPEPGSWALCALGLVFALPRFRRRR